MKLFSWFIKASKSSTSNQKRERGVLTTTQKLEQENVQAEAQATILANELNTFNNNTMWPIAKVKTATMIIKKPSINSYQTARKNSKVKKPKKIGTSLIIMPLGH